MIRIIHGGYPVHAVDADGQVLREYPSLTAAARAYGVAPDTVKQAADHGWRGGGVWWRYADMPAECQPLKAPIRRRYARDAKPTFLNGRWYPSIRKAARAIGVKENTLYMRLLREERQVWNLAEVASTG